MIDHELTDPTGSALTITHNADGVWVTATEDREEATVGPLPARTLRASFDMGDDLADGGVTAAAIEAEVVSPERARSLVQERAEGFEARIEAVRDVHRHIAIETRGIDVPEHRCLDCCLHWPCPTIRALDAP